jgi:prepilin-type N-terminal cleavage/methylation domain-containing protein
MLWKPNIALPRQDATFVPARAAHACPGSPAARHRGAFTLIELLTVIAIIGLLAAIGLPRISSMTKSNATISATRQLLDDLDLARTRAISGRMNVDVVFIPPSITNFYQPFFTKWSPQERTLANNLLGGQFTTYALFATRDVGDQPGRYHPRYLTTWRSLPVGTFIATSKFSSATVNGVPPFSVPYLTCPFPLASSTGTPLALPYIEFDYQGRLTSQRDEIIPLARGSIFYPRDQVTGDFTPQAADVQENPPNNSVTMWNHVRIDWLTGRAHVEHQEIQ